MDDLDGYRCNDGAAMASVTDPEHLLVFEATTGKLIAGGAEAN